MTSQQIRHTVAYYTAVVGDFHSLSHRFVCCVSFSHVGSGNQVFWKIQHTPPLPTSPSSPQKCPECSSASCVFSAPHPNTCPSATQSGTIQVQSCSKAFANCSKACTQSYCQNTPTQPQLKGKLQDLESNSSNTTKYQCKILFMKVFDVASCTSEMVICVLI